MTSFELGDTVNVTIERVKVVGMNALTGAPTIIDERGVEFPMPPQAAIEHAVPPEWPPRPAPGEADLDQLIARMMRPAAAAVWALMDAALDPHRIAAAIVAHCYPPHEWPEGPPGEGEYERALDEAEAIIRAIKEAAHG